MSIDTRGSKEGDELAVMITGMVGTFRTRVVGFSDRHDGTAVLQVLENDTGQPHPRFAMNLKGDDYIATSSWAEYAKQS